MRQTIDLTKDNFDRVDFSEAEIVDFFCERKLPNHFEFTIWGATILLDTHWKHDKNFISHHDNKDIYVSGIGKVSIHGLIGGNIEMYIYDNVKDEQNQTIAAKNHDGSNLVFRRQWNSTHGGSNEYEYLWECVIAWPHGFCNLRLYSDGEVSFEYDTDDTVRAEDFVKNPHAFTYKEE